MVSDTIGQDNFHDEDRVVNTNYVGDLTQTLSGNSRRDTSSL